MNSPLHRLLVFAALISALAPARAETPADRLVLGTVYNIFPEEFATDADFFRQVDRDLPAIAAAGFTHVMIFPMSEWDPDTHALRWTRTDYLVHRIEALHLKFVPLLLKEEQCSHYFPIWKFQELGLWDARNVDNGNPNNRENVDFADPRIRPLVDDYLRAVAGRYGPSPALAFYNLWNEPHYQSSAPHVLARFRTWLQHKYGALAALRRAWGDDFSDWSQVSPLLTDDWNSSMPGIDWTLFRNELDGDLLAELREVVRRCDPHHPVNANPVGTPFASFGPFGGYNTDNWQFTQAEDFAGASYYPDAWARAHGFDRAPAWFHDLNFTVFRCAAAPKDYILTELYTNAKTGLTLGGYLDADTARELAWTAFANDCKGLIYWKWDPFRRGRQSLGRGLVDLDGRLAPRGEAAAAIVHAVGRHESLIRTARLAPAQIAIAVDMVGLLKVPQQPAEPRTQNFMYESIAGVFQALDRANLTVDLLRVDRGVSLADLQRYRAVILPFQVVTRRDFAAALRAYVEAGGHVLADARTSTLDEQDFAYAPSPGAGLADLFGASRRDWNATPDDHRVDLPGGSFGGRYFREQLEPRPGTTVLATFAESGAPAIVRHAVGRGVAVLAGVPLGASRFNRDVPALDTFLVRFCTDAGAAAPTTFAGPAGLAPLVRTHLLPDGGRLVYLINPTADAGDGALQLAWPGNAPAQVVDLATDQMLPVQAPTGRLRIPVHLHGHDTLVLHVPR